MKLLFMENEDISDYVYISWFMFKKKNHKDIKQFCMKCLPYFSSKELLLNHRERCSDINGKQVTENPEKGRNVNLRK